MNPTIDVFKFRKICFHFLTVFLSLFLFFIPPSYGGSEVFSELEQVIIDAGGEDAFWSSLTSKDFRRSTVKARYFEAIMGYYGSSSNFTRKSFDAILKQLRVASEQIPGLKNRLLNKNETETSSFQFENNIKTSGRGLNPKAWNDYLELWRKSLAESSRAMTLQEAERVFKGIKGEIDSFEESAARFGRKEKGQKRSSFFQEIKSRSRVVSATSFLLLDLLNSTEVNDLFRAEDADLILHHLEKLKSKDGLSEFDKSIPEIAVGFVKDLIPKQAALFTSTEAFPVKTMTTRGGRVVPVGRASKRVYQANQVIRKIHSLWQFGFLGECVGGSCQYLKGLSAERWLVPALEGVEVYHLSSTNSNYLGFVQKIPIINNETQERVKIIEFASAEFRKEVLIEGPTEAISRSTVFEQWMIADPDQSKIVIGSSSSVDNSGGRRSAVATLNYALGANLGSNKNWNHINTSLSEKIIGLSEPVGLAKNYSGNMITEGTVKGAGDLHAIERVSEGRFQTIDSVITFLTDQEIEKDKLVKSLVLFAQMYPKAIELRDFIIQGIEENKGGEKLPYLEAYSKLSIPIDPEPTYYNTLLEIVMDTEETHRPADFFSGLSMLLGGTPSSPELQVHERSFEIIAELRFTKDPPRELVEGLMGVFFDEKARPHHHRWTRKTLLGLRYYNGFPDRHINFLLQMLPLNLDKISILAQIPYGKKVPEKVNNFLLNVIHEDKNNSFTLQALAGLEEIGFTKDQMTEEQLNSFQSKFWEILVSNNFNIPRKKVWALASSFDILTDLKPDQYNLILDRLIEGQHSFEYEREFKGHRDVLHKIKFSRSIDINFLEKLEKVLAKRGNFPKLKYLDLIGDLVKNSDHLGFEAGDLLLKILFEKKDRLFFQSRQAKLRTIEILEKFPVVQGLEHRVQKYLQTIANKKMGRENVKSLAREVLSARSSNIKNSENNPGKNGPICEPLFLPSD